MEKQKKKQKKSCNLVYQFDPPWPAFFRIHFRFKLPTAEKRPDWHDAAMTRRVRTAAVDRL